MDSLFLNMFLSLKLSFMLRCLFAVFLFSWKLPKQPRYWGRLITWSAFCFLVAFLIPVLAQSTFYVTSMFLVEFLLAMCGIKICCKTEWSVVFYIGAAALSAEHIASMIDSLVAMLWPDVLSFSRVHQITWPILLNWVFIAAVVYVIVYRWMFQSKSITLEQSLTYQITLMLLIQVGGLGFLVWEDLFRCRWRVKRWRLHTKLVMSVSAILTFGGALLFFFFEAGATGAGLTRTAGFNTVDIASMAGASKLLTIFLMVIGGSPGSTAGGVKTTSLAVIVLFANASFRDREKPTVLPRRRHALYSSTTSSTRSTDIMMSCAGQRPVFFRRMISA